MGSVKESRECGKEGHFHRSVRANRKTKSSRALWGELGWNWKITGTYLFC